MRGGEPPGVASHVPKRNGVDTDAVYVDEGAAESVKFKLKEFDDVEDKIGRSVGVGVDDIGHIEDEVEVF
jgi:hypothetical protein